LCVYVRVRVHVCVVLYSIINTGNNNGCAANAVTIGPLPSVCMYVCVHVCQLSTCCHSELSRNSKHLACRTYFKTQNNA